jgi:hypothetical protein
MISGSGRTLACDAALLRFLSILRNKNERRRSIIKEMFKNGKRNKFEVIIAYARFFHPAEKLKREREREKVILSGNFFDFCLK